MPEKMIYGKLDRHGWPVHWPILTENDICHNQYIDGEGRCCLSGWFRMVFKGSVEKKARGRQADKAESVFRKLTGFEGQWMGEWNDKTPKKKIAKVWNALGKKLGYDTVVNVET